MEGQETNDDVVIDVVIGDSLSQKGSQLHNKTGKKSSGRTTALFTFIRSLHVGKVRSQQQHDSENTKPLEGLIVSKDLVNRCEGMKFVFHDTNMDADSSNYLTGLLYCLYCCMICPGKVNELEYISYETLISQRINQDGRGTPHRTLILSKEPADARGNTSKQSFEKVKLSEHTIILQVSSANSYAFTEEVVKEIAEMFQLHFNEGIQVVYLLRQIFYVTTIKGEKPKKLVRTGVRGDTIWEPQHQLKIIELVGRYFKAKEDLVKGMHLEQIPSKKIKY